LKTLVTGAAGFVGGAVTRRLLECGERDVRCLVRRDDQARRLHRLGEEFPQATIECVRGDLLTPSDAGSAVEGVGTIYHLAAAMSGGYSEMVMNTVVGSRNLLEAIAEPENVRVVLVSSFSVYGTAELADGYRVDEDTPLESHPTKRGAYAYAKLRQERLFVEFAAQTGLRIAILRPGVIYGPGGGRFSPRVGVQLPGLFLHLGRGNEVPFTYVDNCAQAIVAVGRHDSSWGEVYNVVDDTLRSSAQYLHAYRREVRRIRYLTLPFPLMMLLSRCVEWYHRWSRGQLPAVFTPYNTRSLWRGNTFSNDKLKALGWEQVVTTEEGMRRTFAHFRDEDTAGRGG
jgi:nucleoside-diphosphate-sugar epimerase